MRTVLIGAGSIGGPLAVLMQEKGYDIDVVAHGADKARLIREEGFHVTGALGEHCERLNAYGSIAELSGKYDICFISTKYQQMPDVAREMLPYLNDDSLVLSLQNGIVTDLLAEVVGDRRTVACMIGVGATLISPNHVEITAVSEFRIGTPYIDAPASLEKVVEMMSSLCKTSVDDHIIASLYAKVIFNSATNSLAAITGHTVGYILDTKEARRAELAIIREAVAIADKMGIDIPRFNMLPKFQTVSKLKGPIPDFLFSQFLRYGFKFKSRNVRPSTLQSLSKGLKTEIDIMNGYLSAKGKEYGVPTPVNDSLTHMIKQIENGELSIHPDNIYKI